MKKANPRFLLTVVSCTHREQPRQHKPRQWGRICAQGFIFNSKVLCPTNLEERNNVGIRVRVTMISLMSTAVLSDDGKTKTCILSNTALFLSGPRLGIGVEDAWIQPSMNLMSTCASLLSTHSCNLLPGCLRTPNFRISSYTKMSKPNGRGTNHHWNLDGTGEAKEWTKLSLTASES